MKTIIGAIFLAIGLVLSFIYDCKIAWSKDDETFLTPNFLWMFILVETVIVIVGFVFLFD